MDIKSCDTFGGTRTDRSNTCPSKAECDEQILTFNPSLRNILTAGIVIASTMCASNNAHGQEENPSTHQPGETVRITSDERGRPMDDNSQTLDGSPVKEAAENIEGEIVLKSNFSAANDLLLLDRARDRPPISFPSSLGMLWLLCAGYRIHRYAVNLSSDDRRNSEA